MSDALTLLENDVPLDIRTDTRDYEELLKSAEALAEGELRRVKHERLAAYQTYTALEEEMEVNPDPELIRVQRLIERGRIGYVIGKLDEYNRDAAKHRKAVGVQTLTTAHKCKGLQWAQVRLGYDFPIKRDPSSGKLFMPEEESNLLYVAATRAEAVLEVYAVPAEANDEMRLF